MTTCSGKRQPIKLCMISSSGGHYEELSTLKVLKDEYFMFWVTEKTDYSSPADYYLLQTGLRDFLAPFRMAINLHRSIRIWSREKPDVVITTGTMIALPMCMIAKILRKKVIFIESFARVHDGTRTGRFMYRFADLFIYQWESLGELYPEGVYGGSIF